MKLQVCLGGDRDLLQVFYLFDLIDINMVLFEHLLIKLGMCLQIG